MALLRELQTLNHEAYQGNAKTRELAECIERAIAPRCREAASAGYTWIQFPTFVFPCHGDGKEPHVYDLSDRSDDVNVLMRMLEHRGLAAQLVDGDATHGLRIWWNKN